MLKANNKITRMTSLKFTLKQTLKTVFLCDLSVPKSYFFSVKIRASEKLQEATVQRRYFLSSTQQCTKLKHFFPNYSIQYHPQKFEDFF